MSDDDAPIALVTGAGGDIGRAIAVALAGDGCRLVLCERPGAEAALDATLEACRAAHGAVDPTPVTFDVTDPAAVDRHVATAVAEVGVATRVVCSAGHQGEFANVLDHDAGELARVLSINVAGTFAVLRATGRAMRDAGVGGSMVTLASMAAHGAPNMAAYSASKGAVVSLTRAAAKDLAPLGIRVNSVSPGFIGPGAMWDRQVELQASTPSPYYADDVAAVADQMIGQVPLARYGSTEEVADVVRFLLSDASSYVTGSDVEVAGGA